MMKFSLFGALLLTGVAANSVQAAPIIKEVTPATLQSAIRAQKGRVVVVNFWATWCAPCVAELPAFAQLQKQYGKRGVTVLLVSADEASAKPLVSKTLASRGHNKTFLIKGDMVKFFDGFDPKFKGAVALPRTYIYNRAGQAAKAVNSEHTFAQYAKMVTPYL
ncbi:MAG TPA: TlpA family protein disulfide reductase [Abditibacterium sp.]|jgi:thiol-disulfide isomerase/thioredoxin